MPAQRVGGGTELGQPVGGLPQFPHQQARTGEARHALAELAARGLIQSVGIGHGRHQRRMRQRRGMVLQVRHDLRHPGQQRAAAQPGVGRAAVATGRVVEAQHLPLDEGGRIEPQRQAGGHLRHFAHRMHDPGAQGQVEVGLGRQARRLQPDIDALTALRVHPSRGHQAPAAERAGLGNHAGVVPHGRGLGLPFGLGPLARRLAHQGAHIARQRRRVQLHRLDEIVAAQVTAQRVPLMLELPIKHLGGAFPQMLDALQAPGISQGEPALALVRDFAEAGQLTGTRCGGIEVFPLEGHQLAAQRPVHTCGGLEQHPVADLVPVGIQPALYRSKAVEGAQRPVKTQGLVAVAALPGQAHQNRCAELPLHRHGSSPRSVRVRCRSGGRSAG